MSSLRKLKEDSEAISLNPHEWQTGKDDVGISCYGHIVGGHEDEIFVLYSAEHWKSKLFEQGTCE